MLSIARINPLARAIGVISAVAILATGVTMAAFNTNTVALENNTITVNNDVLRIWNGSGFGTSATGFSFDASMGVESEKMPFYLQNLSDVDINLSARLDVAPSPTNVALEDVKVMVYDQNNDLVLDTTLAALASDVPFTGGHVLEGGATGNGDPDPTEGDYTISVKVTELTPGSATTASVPSFNLLFTGTTIEP